MRLRGSLMLLAAAFFWGTTFVAQILGMEGLGPYTYAAARFALGTLFMTALWLLYRGQRKAQRRAGTFHSGFRAGIPVGLAMFVGVTLQQVALLSTTAGKTAFITTLYIVLVPLAAVLLGHRIRAVQWGGALLAFLGVYFLSAYGETTLNQGDVLVFLCAFFWMVQILLIDRFARMVDAIELCLMEMLICTLGSALLAVCFELCGHPLLRCRIHLSDFGAGACRADAGGDSHVDGGSICRRGRMGGSGGDDERSAGTWLRSAACGRGHGTGSTESV